MIKLSLHYEWEPEPGRRTVLDATLFRVLRAIHETGSIAAAARRVDMSYRHVWGLTGKWERRLGRPLVTLQRGRGARLTEFGEKLLCSVPGIGVGRPRAGLGEGMGRLF